MRKTFISYNSGLCTCLCISLKKEKKKKVGSKAIILIYKQHFSCANSITGHSCWALLLFSSFKPFSLWLPGHVICSWGIINHVNETQALAKE
jgi:hypothetical protein